VKKARAAFAWLDEAARHGAAGLDYSAVVLSRSFCQSLLKKGNS
jgi:hypothetical protein